MRFQPFAVTPAARPREAGPPTTASPPQDLERWSRELRLHCGSTAARVATPLGRLPDDDPSLRCHAQRIVRGQGVDAALHQIREMEASLQHFRALGGGAESVVRLKRMIAVMHEELGGLEAERVAFLEKFRPHALATARGFLEASRQTANAAIAAYGVERGFDEALAVVYSTPHPEKVRSLVEAARSLGSELQQLERVSESYGLAMTSPDAAAGGRTLAQLTQSLDRQKRALEAEWRARSAEHPILAALHPSDLQRLAAGEGNALYVLNRYGTAVLESIEEMEERLNEDPDAVFRLVPVIEATKAELGLDPSSLGAAFADHQVAAVGRDDRLVQSLITLATVTLGVAAALPSGGTSLAIASALSSAADLCAFVDALQRFDFAADARRTDPNPDRALSKEQPALLWLVLQGLGVAIGVVGTSKALGASGFDRALRRADALGEAARRVEIQIGASEAKKLFSELGKERFAALASEMPGDLLRASLDSHGADVVAYALDELNVFQTKQLLARFDRATIAAVASNMGPRALRAVAFEYGDHTVKTLAPILGGDGLARLHLAGPNAKRFIDCRLKRDKLGARDAMIALKNGGADESVLRVVQTAGQSLPKQVGASTRPSFTKAQLAVDAAFEPVVQRFQGKAAQVFGSARLSDDTKKLVLGLLTKADETGRFEEAGLKRWLAHLAGAENDLQAEQAIAELERGLAVAAGRLHPEGQIVLSAKRGTHTVGPGRSVEITKEMMEEVDVLYLGADGKVHAEEVKHRAQALREKLFGAKGDQLNLKYLERMEKWKNGAGDRTVSVVIGNDRGWFDMFVRGPDGRHAQYYLDERAIKLVMGGRSLTHEEWTKIGIAWEAAGKPKDGELF